MDKGYEEVFIMEFRNSRKSRKVAAIYKTNKLDLPKSKYP